MDRESEGVDMSIEFSDEELSEMSEERLCRKADQSWEMAGLARQDGDAKDAQRHTEFANRLQAELSSRRLL